MKKKTVKKLALAKETVRDLDLQAVRGGNPTVWYDCWGTYRCPDVPWTG